MLVVILVVVSTVAAGILGLGAYFYVKHRNGVEPLTADEVDLLQRQDEFLIPNRGKFTGLKQAKGGKEVKKEDEDQNAGQDQESDSSEDIQCGCGCGKRGCCYQQ